MNIVRFEPRGIDSSGQVATGPGATHIDGDVCFGSLSSALFLIAEVHHVVSRDRR